MKIEEIHKQKNFKDKIDGVDLLLSEVKKLKKSKKFDDRSYYTISDFIKSLEFITSLKAPTVDNCFNTKVEILSAFGVRSADLSVKDLPDGAKKGIVLLNFICKKK